MFSFIYFILGIVLTIILSAPGIEIIQRIRKRLTWKAVMKALRNSSLKSQIDKFKPDVIVGLNSGIVPASILALNYDIEELVFYNVLSEYDENGKEVETPIPDKEISFSGKRILLIDSQAYSGRSMNRLFRHLQTKNPEEIKKLAIFKYLSVGSRLDLDFESPGKIKGQVKIEPWVFSSRLLHYYKHRGKRGTS